MEMPLKGACARCWQRPAAWHDAFCIDCLRAVTWEMSMEMARRFPPTGPKPTTAQIEELVMGVLDGIKTEIKAKLVLSSARQEAARAE